MKDLLKDIKDCPPCWIVIVGGIVIIITVIDKLLC